MSVEAKQWKLKSIFSCVFDFKLCGFTTLLLSSGSGWRQIHMIYYSTNLDLFIYDVKQISPPRSFLLSQKCVANILTSVPTCTLRWALFEYKLEGRKVYSFPLISRVNTNVLSTNFPLWLKGFGLYLLTYLITQICPNFPRNKHNILQIIQRGSNNHRHSCLPWI